MPETFNDLTRKVGCKNYAKFPTDAFASLWDYGHEIAGRLREVHVPIRVLQSKKDQVIAPESANIIYEKVSSPHREIIWYQKSGHEMMQDLEAETVFRDVMEYVHKFELHPKMSPRLRGPADQPILRS
jgi:carboxylesterase